MFISFLMYKLSVFKKNNEENLSFTQVLKTKWNELHAQTNVFRYNINNLKEKIVGGAKYFLQLNPERGSNRRAPEEIKDVCTPFQHEKFNFTKVSSNEVLFNLVQDENEADIHSILINVSPISRYHSLLCPSVNQCLSQIATKASLQLALDIMFLAEDRDIRIGFNSLCALASVNHLHYHIFYEPNTLPIENVESVQLKDQLHYIEDYPVPAFCFAIPNESCIAASTENVYKLVQYLIKKCIAHNIFITRGKQMSSIEDFQVKKEQKDDKKEVGKSVKEEEIVRVVIWPRKSCYGVKQLGAFNVAVCELSGWFPVFNTKDFENLTTKDLEIELKKWKIDDFQQLCNELREKL